jgi:hypothetical protein
LPSKSSDVTSLVSGTSLSSVSASSSASSLVSKTSDVSQYGSPSPSNSLSSSSSSSKSSHVTVLETISATSTSSASNILVINISTTTVSKVTHEELINATNINTTSIFKLDEINSENSQQQKMDINNSSMLSGIGGGVFVALLFSVGVGLAIKYWKKSTKKAKEKENIEELPNIETLNDGQVSYSINPANGTNVLNVSRTITNVHKSSDISNINNPLKMNDAQKTVSATIQQARALQGNKTALHPLPIIPYSLYKGVNVDRSSIKRTKNNFKAVDDNKIQFTPIKKEWKPRLATDTNPTNSRHGQMEIFNILKSDN